MAFRKNHSNTTNLIILLRVTYSAVSELMDTTGQVRGGRALRYGNISGETGVEVWFDAMVVIQQLMKW